MSLKVIAFDADDTLWVNEPYFSATEAHFCAMMEDFMPGHAVSRALQQSEMQNLALYGYGVKSFILSMVETAVKVSGGTIGASGIQKILDLGKEMIEKPIELLDGVEEVLRALHGKYRLVVATKGDLLDQERKLKKSGLEHYFHHIEVMSEKAVPDYEKLIRHLDIQPSELMMIGNSLKSDVLPVLEMGGWGVHVPFHTNWVLDHVEVDIVNDRFRKMENIREVINLIQTQHP